MTAAGGEGGAKMKRFICVVLMAVAWAGQGMAYGPEDDARAIRARIAKIDVRLGEIRAKLRRLLPHIDLDSKYDVEFMKQEKTLPYELEMKMVDAWQALRSQTQHKPNLETLEAQRRNTEEMYDRQLEKAWVTLDRPVRILGWVLDWERAKKPWSTGIGNPDLRAAYKKWQDAQKARAAEIQRLDKVVADNPVSGYKDFRSLQEAVTKVYDKYGRRLEKGGAETRRLFAEFVRLKQERDRLEKLLKAKGNFVIWTNDVGWIYVGTVEGFEGQKGRARGSEIWGGRSTESMRSWLLDQTRYGTLEDAVVAVGKNFGKARRHFYRLAHPRVTYRVKAAGRERFLKPIIYEHSAYKEYMPTGQN